MINTIKKWIESIQKYDDVLILNSEFSIELRQAREELEELQERVNELTYVDSWQEYWLDRHPKINISYARVESDDNNYKIDVRSFFIPNYSYPNIKGKTQDEIAFKCLAWIMKKITYVTDKSNYGYDEFWAMPYQTLKRKKGDCEDGAILLANIMLHNGVDSWRVRINAGDVDNPSGTGKVGHAYVTYFRETDGQSVILDWCYWKSFNPIKDRPLFCDSTKYQGIWWSTDREQTYGNKKYMKRMPKAFKLEVK